ncbi:phosphoenolpyruvate carboxykinase (ATP) [candidate division KSB1 bacterium]|nr:phosphoenolpyruvate carboxykinase (ATP) [candidate division KSB1 bacterium]
MELETQLFKLLQNHHDVHSEFSRSQLIEQVVDFKEAIVAANGCLATWTEIDSTGRSPKDTLIVRYTQIEKEIDWDSPNNLPLDSATFADLWTYAIEVLSKKKRIFVTNRVIGADAGYAMPVRTVTSSPLTALFTHNMFRPEPADLTRSLFADRRFHLLVLPYDKVADEKYRGRLRTLPDGRTSNMVIVMDFLNRLGLVFGSAYQGSVKKLAFTVMNYYLPQEGILPLHCSANESKEGSLALFLGLSGTGKTTLSADPHRALLGDDEHGWSDNGIANFEFGCYAKLINLNPEKEPEIHRAVFHRDDYRKHGAIVENAMMYPNGTFDLDDERLTPNSRASYPLSFLNTIKLTSDGPHPRTIIFLTADANGVLPPVAKLTPDQAMLWFLMGYTSKLAGTETGIIEPVSTFSRFFGQPFMPCLPDRYAGLLGKRLKKHGTRVFLVNTGWSGGAYGTGKRMDINLTRAIINAALNDGLETVPLREDPLFHLQVPLACTGVPDEFLDPARTWNDKSAFTQRAEKLAQEFSHAFDQAYGGKRIDKKVAAMCPGK